MTKRSRSNTRKSTKRNRGNSFEYFDSDYLKTFLYPYNDPHSDSDDTPPEPAAPKCANPLCKHKSTDTIEDITMTEIKDITDLIYLGKRYHCKKRQEFNGINLRILCNLVTPLTELQNMIGMHTVKQDMVNQIMFFLQGFNNNNKCGKCIDCTYSLPCPRNNNDMLHTVIVGPPGVGKTELAKIIGKVYKEMNILSRGTFRAVTRSDLIGKYLGHTAVQTQNVINECNGGVMFIDEAYSLGHKSGDDSFAKECIDTLNQNLTERRDFLCIIAGYENQLNDCFFAMNEGLKRRFTFTYKIDKYTSDELFDIFKLKVTQSAWGFAFDEPEYKHIRTLFKDNYHSFPHYGGDMETLLLNCKITHSRRCLFDTADNKRKLSISDIERGMSMMTAHRNANKPIYTPPPYGLYV